MTKKVDRSDKKDIKVEWGEQPKDEELIRLLKEAYSGNLLVRTAMIKVEGIKPFSDFVPNISEAFRDYFEKAEKDNFPPPLYVYPQGEDFIMSDDYNSFFLYKQKDYKKIICVILGDSDSKYILEKSSAFILPIPQ